MVLYLYHKEQVNNATLQSKGEQNMTRVEMSIEEIKELIKTTLQETGYMYTLGMLRGMYVAGAFSVEEWYCHDEYLYNLNKEILG